jgi:hypothetical protein
MRLFDRITRLFAKEPRHGPDFDQSSSLQEAPSGWALPPLSSEEAHAVLTQSEFAALEAAPQEGDAANPHPPGSRAHRLWSDNFRAVQSAMGKKR